MSGDPKLITMTHGTFSCTDNDRNMPVPDGRSAQNAAQFNFQQGGKFYSCFPPYHVSQIGKILQRVKENTVVQVILNIF